MKRVSIIIFIIFNHFNLSAQTYNYSLSEAVIENKSLYYVFDTVIHFQNNYCKIKYNNFVVTIFEIESVNYLSVKSTNNYSEIFSLSPIGFFKYDNFSFFIKGETDKIFSLKKTKIDFTFENNSSLKKQIPIIDEIANYWLFKNVDSAFNLVHLNSLCIEMPDSLIDKQDWNFLEKYYEKIEVIEE